MKQNSSSRRVNEQARQVIAEILMFETSDPRLTMTTVTGCEVSFDRSVCNVYVTCAPDAYDETLAALKNASGRIRSLMGKKLTWRVAPEFRFFLDTSVDEAQKIGSALAAEKELYEARASLRGDEADPESAAKEETV